MAGEKNNGDSTFVPWDKLSLYQRLYIWLLDNQGKMDGQFERYKTYFENFTERYEEASIESYLHFKYDLNLNQYPHSKLLIDGFYAIYATSAESLGANGAEPRYRLTTYMKVAETYFSSREDALAEQEHFEAMEGLEQVNLYLIEPICVDKKETQK